MRIKVFAGLGALLLCTQVAAADWKPIYQINGALTHIDRSSIATSGKYKKAWFKTILDEAKPEPTASSKTFRSEMSLYYFSCKERTLGVLATLRHSEDSEVTFQHDYSLSDIKFREVAPETMGETMLATVCANTTSKK